MMRGKKIVVAGAVALGFGQFLWFSIFGPPARWGTGVVDVNPKFEQADAANVVSSDDTVATAFSGASIPDVERQASNIVGRVLAIDEMSPEGAAVLQTYGGKNWTEDQHLYFRHSVTDRWRELPLPRGFIVENPKVVRLYGHATMLVGRWNAWYPATRNYKRFVRSIIDPQLRAEDALYSMDPDSGSIHFLFPGHSIVVSPDRRLAAYMGSENGFSGFHTIRVWNIDSNKSKPVLSLREIDPGSGTSFQYRWIKDSRALLITGDTQGFSPSASGYGKFRIIYLTARDALLNQQSRTRKGSEQ
jgi:hypothetical protein